MSFNLGDLIARVSKDKRLIPDLMKSENGNNFRAISEAAILDAISPYLEEENIFYSIQVKEQHLEIKEAFGSKGKKLQFIATVVITINFYYKDVGQFIGSSDAVGMGIDDNDKAMGKAFTYAVKYALLKLFRLRYGDDSDFEASKPLHLDKVKEEVKEAPKKEKAKKETKKETKPAEKETPPMSEKQRDYIIGLMKKNGITYEEIFNIYGYDVKNDEFIPMPKAREMIKWLEEGCLPF